MTRRTLTTMATLAPIALVAATLSLTADKTVNGYQWQLGPLQLSYADAPALN